MKCSVVFSLSDLNSNRDITCSQALRELALQELVPVPRELVPQALVPVPRVPQVPEPLLLSSLALQVSFLVRTDSRQIQAKKLLTSAPKE